MGNGLTIDENMYGTAFSNNEAVPVSMDHHLFRESGIIFPPHWHEQPMLMYAKKGVLRLHCAGRDIYAEQGTMAVVNPNEIHSGDNPGSELEYYSLKLDLLLLLGSQPDMRQTMYTELLLKNQLLFENRIAGDTQALGCIQDIIREFELKEEGYELAVRGLVYQLLSILLRRHTVTVSDPSVLDAQYRRLRQIKPAVSYMELHLADKITLESLSEAAHLSPVHFSRVFKTVSGISPMEFLNRMRLQKASQLLVNTDKTVVEIALETGFSDGNYFSRYFKKCRHETPREFRTRYAGRA